MKNIAASKHQKMEASKSLRVEVMSRETIKPLSPCPSDHQGSFKLSMLDQFNGEFYAPLLLFYQTTTSPLSAGGGGGGRVSEIHKRLKSSLSETLTRFYPFAGRHKELLSFSCNDEGVEYSEAQVLNCSLSDVLGKPDPEQLNLLMPEESEDVATRPQFLVQVSFFECGGMALGMKFSHKITDAATITSFIKCWADSSSHGNAANLVTPDFSSAYTRFPLLTPTDSSPAAPRQTPPKHKTGALRVGRFVFGPSQLAELQAKATSTNNPRPTRFQAISAFIWRIALLSEKESRPPGLKKPSALTWAVNLRSKLQPPLPEQCFGNLIGQAVHEISEVDGEDDSLPSLAARLRRGTIDLCNNFNQTLQGDQSVQGTFELLMKVRNLRGKYLVEKAKVYSISSWCNLPVYEADFGWGKPMWASSGGLLQLLDLILFMDTRDGLGIEVWVSMMAEDLARFESNQELQNYASFNPSAFSYNVLRCKI